MMLADTNTKELDGFYDNVSGCVINSHVHVFSSLFLAYSHKRQGCNKPTTGEKIGSLG